MCGQRIYLVGPTTGRPRHNLDAFLAAAEALRAGGDEVTSTLELLLAHGLDPDRESAPSLRPETAALIVDSIAGADLIALLPDWQSSPSAVVTFVLAEAFGVEIVELAA